MKCASALLQSARAESSLIPVEPLREATQKEFRIVVAPSPSQSKTAAEAAAEQSLDFALRSQGTMPMS